ncbi:short chain dehydrogenase domain-containing protein [Phthorimaea operculella]|nr:short chain dehydrogenase domain-containing protein [Phthorimaea operculella]
MQRWAGKTAVVTGAAGAIGGAIADRLSKEGLMEKQNFLQCDLSDLTKLAETFKTIEEQYGGVDVMVNCAGYAKSGHITSAGPNKISDADIAQIMDVNIRAMIFCCRYAVDSMKKRGVDGHIININSIAGHYVAFSDTFNVYSSSKHAVTAFTQSLFQEMSIFKCKTKITSISPGMVETPMTRDKVDSSVPRLQPCDVADTVVYALSTPPHVNISELTVQPRSVEMDRWCGKTAVVTGASAGIGAAICVSLANEGLNVLGLARRPQLVDDLRAQVTGKGSIRSRQCDVSKLEDVDATFSWVEEHMGGVSVMVNNAGVMHPGHITDAGDRKLSDSEISSVIDINLKGLIFCSRRAVASMKKHGRVGHIININSIAGHYIPFAPLFNVYAASKHGVTAFTGSLLNELAAFKNNIKVTSISPGLVETGMIEEGKDVIDFKPLQPKDIADAILYVVSTPPSVNITELTIQPVQEKRL